MIIIVANKPIAIHHCVIQFQYKIYKQSNENGTTY